ncbi:hypothetical protein DFH09DRAFT_1321230 [Mycena vulgaris]|nr:hypothetical protein DFH09DRAFT_1321230 [Mycena vulgaris]
MYHWCVFPWGLDPSSTLTRRIARSLALLARIFDFHTCRTRRAPAVFKNTTNPSTALERPSSAPRDPPRAHAAAPEARGRDGPAHISDFAYTSSRATQTCAMGTASSSHRSGGKPRSRSRSPHLRLRTRDALALKHLLYSIRTASRRSRARGTSPPLPRAPPAELALEDPRTVPEERRSANHKQNDLAPGPRFVALQSALDDLAAFRLLAVGLARADAVATTAHAESLNAIVAPRPPSSPFAPRNTDAVVDTHASSPSAPRETDAFVATAHVEPLNAVVARAAPHPGRSRRPRPTPLWTRCTLSRLTAPSRVPLALIFARRRRARRPSPARFLAGLESPRWRAPRVLGDPSSGALGAAAYGALRPARMRRVGDDTQLVREGLLQQLEAAGGVCAFGPSRCWRRSRPLACAYAGAYFALLPDVAVEGLLEPALDGVGGLGGGG